MAGGSTLGNISNTQVALNTVDIGLPQLAMHSPYETAIKATKDAYMPNAKRKKMYLQIYADVAKQNETLVKQLVQMSNASKTKELLPRGRCPARSHSLRA